MLGGDVRPGPGQDAGPFGIIQPSREDVENVTSVLHCARPASSNGRWSGSTRTTGG